ncbi:MAG: IS21 family transposase [Victivallales bacterium]|nr:IS21 family transposase [Victivallales bacterium]
MTRYSRHLQIHQLTENEKLSAKQIAARLKISIKTVARHLKIERYSPPKAHRVSRKIDPYKEQIKHLLERYDYTAVQIFRMLKDEGYPGCESVLRDYVSQVRPRRQTPYLTLNFEPGSSAQVDFAECGLINVGETRRKLYAFVMTLCHSRMVFVKFIMRQNMEHFLQCHREAFEYFHGITCEVMVDNCKVAVKSSSSFGTPLINERYADCAAHYGFKVMPCGVRKPNEKGQVERSVSYLRKSFLNGLERDNLSLTALNHGVRQWMENVANVRHHRGLGKSPAEVFEIEKAALQPLPLFPYDCGVIVNSRANKQYRVVFESNKYSVPPEFAGKRVELGVYPETLAIRCEGKLVVEHARSYEHNRDYGLAEHDKVLIEHRRKAKQGIIMKQFMELGPVADTYYQGIQTRRLNPATHIKKIMALLSVYGSDDVIRALEDGAEAGAFGSDYIANILEVRHRVSPQPGPLHLSRKSDCLDLDIQAPDMDAYDVN